MKILAIRGKNLASLEAEFEVDFRKEPLHSAGLFAITGNTGAGKSTILDAMCAALYSRSPRLDEIKDSVVVERQGRKTVSEHDIRTLLRRGTHSGYAEVDFLAVDGHEYRIRCTMSRANDKCNGFYRDVSYDLTDLTTNEHRSLKKTEYDKLMPELVGLKYEQFTRAVLLAQGKFSVFLKSDNNEKATILETLTGTQIYSRISVEIYTRAQKAKDELDVIAKQIEALHILKKEQLEELNEKRMRLDEELKVCSAALDVLKMKRSWVERAAQLERQLEQAAVQLQKAQEEHHSIAPVVNELLRIDSVQPIRDDYMALRNLKQEQIAVKQQLSVIKRELETKTAEYEIAVELAKKADVRQGEVNDELLAAQPRIMEAATLEKECEGLMKAAQESECESKKKTTELKNVEVEVERCRKNILLLETEKQQKEQWFEEHASYSTVVPMVPSIAVNMKSAANERVQVEMKRKSLAQANKMLEEFEKQMADARVGEEKLKQTMSSEIAALRERLVDGEPCPVCGSREHLVVEIAQNLLQEKELDKARDLNRKLIEHTESSMARCRSEIEKLESAIEFHNNAIEKYNSANLEFMAGVPGAAELLDSGDAIKWLTTLSENWNRYKERLAVIVKELALNNDKVSIFGKRKKELAGEIALIDEQAALLATKVKGVGERAKEILGNWSSAEKMQQHYNTLVADANKAFVAAVESRNRIDIERNRFKGQIAEKEKQAADAEKAVALLTKKVDDFLATRNDGLDTMGLDALASTSPNVVAAMRERIKRVEDALTAANTTIAERRKNVEEHGRAAVRPADGEDATFIANGISKVEREQKLLIEQASAIKAQLIADAENREQHKCLSEKCDAMREKKEHWDELNAVFGSATGHKLKKLAQEYTLDILLELANKHLADITKRYRLERFFDDSLSIKVIDLHMMSESRSAHTLSGGETFIVSLALALALSSISSNRMSIGSLFIDEGVGALDSDTLRTAMMALERLQSQGRKIGVISHLGEMLEQIPVKVQVRSVSPGKSVVEIIDNFNS